MRDRVFSYNSALRQTMSKNQSSESALGQLRKVASLAKENLHYVQPAITGLLRSEFRSGIALNDMQFYAHNRPLPVNEIYPLKERPRDVVIFVHGLMGDEIQWGETKGTQVNLAETWADRYDILPLFVRYNSGEHISTNGQRLATLIESMFRFYGDGIQSIRLVAHSMGGLVAQSAIYYSQNVFNYAWTQAVRSILFLGTPHNGAGLERITRFSAQLLDTFTVSTRAVSTALKIRSEGIQDLGFGYIADEDWQNQVGISRRTDPPSIPGAVYTLVAGTIVDNPDSREAKILGDGIVGRGNALSERFGDAAPRGIRKITIGGVSHNGLMVDPRIVDLLI